MTQTEPSNPEDAIRVLHVDDEHNPLKFTKSFVELSDSTIHMESIATPEAALRRLEEENFDCVVSDYQMPILNGIELARRIRGFSDIPIIIYTGRGSEEVASKAFAAGIDDYMRKEIEPSHYEVLARRIRSAVEEQRADDALIRSEERYRTLLEQLPDPVTVRIEEKRVYATKRAAEFWGYDDVSELLGVGASEIIAPEDWPIVVERMERRDKGEELPSMYEVKVRKADGSTFDAEIHTASIDYQGTPAVLNITRDITERKRMEEELRESEVRAREARDYLEKLINHTNAPIIVWDPAFKITRFNSGFERLTGYTADEVINRELGILFPEASRGESLSRIDSTLNGVYWESVEIPILCKDGGVRVVLWNSANIYAGDGGAVAATIAQGQDITERKKTEEEVIYLNRLLHAIRNVNQLIVQERDRDKLLNGITRLLVETGGYFNAWIALFDEEGRLASASQSGLGDGFQPLLKLIEGGGLPECGRKALEQPGVHVTGDPVSECTDCLLSGNYHGRSAQSVRLEHGGKVYGLLAASIPRHMITEEEKLLLKEVADDIGYALHSMEVEDEKKRGEWTLRERVKELNCLYAVSNLVESGLDLEGILGGVVALIPPAMQHPEEACVRITLDGRNYETDVFRETSRMLSADIKIQGEKGGSLMVCYPEEAPEGEGWLFLPEEGELVNALAERLGRIIERKRLEEELRRSEEKFRGFLESGMDGVSLVVDDKLVYVNRKGAELLGYDDPSELIGMESIEIVHPSSRHVMLRRKKLRGQGDTKPARYEVEMLRKDGSTFHAEVLSSVIDYEGKPARLAFTRDITERKLYEKRMEALHRHAAELNKVKTMKEAYELTLDAMETSLDFSRGTFLVVEGENLTDVMLRGLDEDRPFSLPLDGKGLTVKAMRTGESVLVPDVSLDPDYIDVGVGINSELAVPVKIDDVAVAVLNTESTELSGYTEQDQVILEVLAEHVSFAIKRISDETERARYRDRLEAIHGYAPEFAQSETLEEIGEKTFDAIESVLGFDFGSFGVVEGDLLRHVYIRGFRGGETFEIPLDEQGVTVTAVKTGETQLIPDVSKCEGYVIGIADGLREPKSELAVPVFVEDVPSGVINVESTRLDAFTEEDRGLLEIFAGHVGSALLRLKQMEELSVSEEKYQSLLESTMDAVVVNDEERYLYANAKAAELLGFEDPSSLVGRRFVEFFAPEFRELVVGRARERLEGGCPINRYSFTMLRVDGSPVEVEANVNVVDYQGKPAVLAVLRNITERKRMEEELLTYSMDLESRIEERTRELLDAERMAAAGSVAAMVGHDLRSPLQSIKNAAYFLRKSPESFDESLRVIDDSVDRATKMIEELRDQTREDPITFTTKVDLGAMMAKAVEEAILPEGVNAVVEVGDGLESVLVDASKFRRVMDNLIRNAVEAMPKGGELRVEARLNVGEVLVEVSDTGVGMPEEVMGELFKPFYTMKAGGLGLGLAYCKRAVEAHGGTIEVESEIDKRTTFTIRLHNEHE